jgi:hypothetical protein
LFWRKETQTDRIKKKLEKARRKDEAFTVFGSSSHKYKVHEKLTAKELTDWQAKNQVTLPEPYALFLTEVGNGGAGPYYGIYPLDKATSSTEGEAMAAACNLRPGMTKEEWNQLAEPLISDEDIPDEEYDAAHNKVMGGMLCMGTQGCEYDMYLVLEGKHKGRIVYTSAFYPDHPFFFVYEDSFLDWYERWLDEIILDYDIAWFGSRMPGDEKALIKIYQNATDEETQSQALDAMFKIKKSSETTIAFLKSIADQEHKDRITAIRLICKTSFDEGRGYLIKLLCSDSSKEFLQALIILYAYGKSADLTEFIQVILHSLDRVDDEKTLRHVGYVLEPSGAITLQSFARFLCHPESKMQAAAVYATRDCRNKSDDWEIIEQMFKSGGKEAMKNGIQYWGVIPHEKLLPYYKAAWPDYMRNSNFREKFVDCLKELNLPEDYFEQE